MQEGIDSVRATKLIYLAGLLSTAACADHEYQDFSSAPEEVADDGGIVQDGSDDFSSQESLLTGTNDTTTTPAANAVVRLANSWYGVGCVGTLVAPDIVLTSGHCVIGVLPPGGACVDCAPANGTTCVSCNAGNPVCAAGQTNCVTNDMGDFNGQWQTLPSGNVQVTVGNDTLAAGNWTTTSTSYNTLQWIGHPMTGHEDIVLIGLATPVPATEAVPRAIRYTQPSNISSSNFTVVGWNQNCTPLSTSCLRRRASSGSYSNNAPNEFFSTLTGGVIWQAGDSGGPTLFGTTTTTGDIVGVNQRGAGTSVIGTVKTFGTGNASRPNVSAWLQPNTLRSFCSATGTTVSQLDSGNHRQLHSWYSPTRLDNIAHTDPAWFGCIAGFDQFLVPDYQFWRREGWVAAPDRPQPSGTTSLNLYWNATQQDNAISTSSPGAGWSYVSRLGYVWTSSGSGRIALRRWFSAARQDYLTTSSGINYSGSGYVDQGIIGWVRSPSLSL